MHAHTWTVNPAPTGATDAHACEECTETSAACTLHDGPSGSSLLVCEPCLNREHSTLTQIARAMTETVTYRPPVLSAYAPDLASARSSDPDMLPFRLDAITDDLEAGLAGVRTPGGIEAHLWGWVALWAEATGDYTNQAATDYLRAHLMWAIHNPDASRWDTYRGEIRRILATARSLQPPETEPAGAHCLNDRDGEPCGGRIVRQWGDDGLGERTYCETCKRPYEGNAWRLALRARIEGEAGRSIEAMLTETQLVEIYPTLGSGVVRKWAERKHVARGRSRDGRTTYRLGDVLAMMEGRAEDAG